MGYYDTPGYAEGVALSDSGFIYVADYTNVGIYRFTDPAKVDDSFIPHPSSFILLPPYPNPFNSMTCIAYSLPMLERITVKIFDLSGREVATLVDGRLEAGNYDVYWNGLNTPSGVYVCRMEAGSFTKSVKLALVR